jgi:GrpB-like predicted nucleotidyltransferase (UPF0157 family)
LTRPSHDPQAEESRTPPSDRTSRPAKKGGQKSAQIVLCSKHSDWSRIYGTEVFRIRGATDVSCRFDHVGSTAVSGLPAKPIIDILVTLTDWTGAEAIGRDFSALGYELQERIDGDAPRSFFYLRESGKRPAIQIHLVAPGQAWGSDMLIFRDTLSADRGLRRRYANLKKELVRRHDNDLNSYTAGKSEFVREAVTRVQNAFSTDAILTHQRAELGRAQLLHILALVAQLGMAAAVAGSVFVNTSEMLLTLAIIGLVLAMAWLQLTHQRNKHTNAGNQARRIALLKSGLDVPISAARHREILRDFTVSIAERKLMMENAYFSSQEEPGPRRLVELIEESAFWTSDLQRWSGLILGWFTVGALVLVGIFIWRMVTDLGAEQQILLARVLVASLVFLVSSEVVVNWLAHRQAASDITEILSRVEVIASQGYDLPDAMLLMSDYNAVVESAPGILPSVFALRRGRLKAHWRAYLTRKQTNARS